MLTHFDASQKIRWLVDGLMSFAIALGLSQDDNPCNDLRPGDSLLGEHSEHTVAGHQALAKENPVIHVHPRLGHGRVNTYGKQMTE
jgi:hypothetical protein